MLLAAARPFSVERSRNIVRIAVSSSGGPPVLPDKDLLGIQALCSSCGVMHKSPKYE
jgi:hypothetical protein